MPSATGARCGHRQSKPNLNGPGSAPARHRKSVVFPEPFGPIRPRISFDRTENPAPRSAQNGPNRFERSSTRTGGAGRGNATLETKAGECVLYVVSTIAAVWPPRYPYSLRCLHDVLSDTRRGPQWRRSQSSRRSLQVLGARRDGSGRGGDVRGTVTDSRDAYPDHGCARRHPTPERVAITDDHGGVHHCATSRPASTRVHVGDRPQPDSSTVTVTAGGSATLDVSLKEGSLLLSSVIVSATRTPVEASKVASTVNVLTPEQVRQSPARESQDLLREIPAVELPRTSSLVGGTAQIVSIRGVDEGRTAVIFDGIPINDAWGEWIDWGRVPKSMLDRVEVVEGGTSSLYGNGAMGGADLVLLAAAGAGRDRLPGRRRQPRRASTATAAAGIPLVRRPDGERVRRLSGEGRLQPDRSRQARGDRRRLADHPAQRLRAAQLRAVGELVGVRRRPLFGDSRGTGTPLSYANRDQRNVDFGVNYGADSALECSTVRGWDGRQIETQRSDGDSLRRARSPRTRASRRPFPATTGAGRRSGRAATSAWLESFSVGGDFRHYQGDFNEVDFNTTCPGANCGCHRCAHVSSGGAQSSERRVRAGDRRADRRRCASS